MDNILDNNTLLNKFYLTKQDLIIFIFILLIILYILYVFYNDSFNINTHGSLKNEESSKTTDNNLSNNNYLMEKNLNDKIINIKPVNFSYNKPNPIPIGGMTKLGIIGYFSKFK